MGRGVESVAVTAWLRLIRVYQKITQAATAQLRPFGVTLAQFDVLAHVGAAEGITQQELADRLLVTKGNVSQLVDRLERAGLMSRRPEGRACHLRLTDAGRAVYREAIPAHEAFVDRHLAALSRDEQAELLGLLRTLDRSLPPSSRLTEPELSRDPRE
jgi:DNA-binding MarR family transcriptional regulator